MRRLARSAWTHSILTLCVLPTSACATFVPDGSSTGDSSVDAQVEGPSTRVTITTPFHGGDVQALGASSSVETLHFEEVEGTCDDVPECICYGTSRCGWAILAVRPPIVSSPDIVNIPVWLNHGGVVSELTSASFVLSGQGEDPETLESVDLLLLQDSRNGSCELCVNAVGVMAKGRLGTIGFPCDGVLVMEPCGPWAAR